MRTCCLQGAGVCPVGGPPHGGVFNKLATILRTCSSGAPLPPNGSGAPSPLPCPVYPALCPVVAIVPGMDPLPPNSSFLLYGLGGCLLLSLPYALCGECVLLFGGCPPPPLPVRGVSPPHSPSPSLAGCAQGARVAAQGVTPPTPSPGCLLGNPAV